MFLPPKVLVPFWFALAFTDVLCPLVGWLIEGLEMLMADIPNRPLYFCQKDIVAAMYGIFTNIYPNDPQVGGWIIFSIYWE